MDSVTTGQRRAQVVHAWSYALETTAVQDIRNAAVTAVDIPALRLYTSFPYKVDVVREDEPQRLQCLVFNLHVFFYRLPTRTRSSIRLYFFCMLRNISAKCGPIFKILFVFDRAYFRGGPI